MLYVCLLDMVQQRWLLVNVVQKQTKNKLIKSKLHGRQMRDL